MTRRRSPYSKVWSFTGVDDVIVDFLRRVNGACHNNAYEFI